MPRPSLAQTRKEEILSAYERCVAQYGVRGTTLKLVAEEAGLARPLLRHFVGNQADLLYEAVDRFLARSEERFAEMPPSDFASLTDFVTGLFAAPDEPSTNTLIACAFAYDAINDDHVKDQMSVWLGLCTAWFEAHVRHHHPAAPAGSVKAVAAGIMGIYFNVDSLIPISAGTPLRAHSLKAALVLADSLASAPR